MPIASLLALDGTGNAAASSATQVWTYNEATGKNELKPVNHVFVNEDPAITSLELKHQDGSSEQIITTPEHPFYVQAGTRNTPSSTGYGPAQASSAGHGDLGPNWVGAGHLKLGDQIRKFDGSSGTVVNVLTLAETRTMYNLDVVGNDNFFVGRSSALVHNADWCDVAYADVLKLTNSQAPFVSERATELAGLLGSQNRIGFANIPGGLAGVIEREALTGNYLSPTGHFAKGQNAMNALKRYIKQVENSYHMPAAEKAELVRIASQQRDAVQYAMSLPRVPMVSAPPPRP